MSWPALWSVCAAVLSSVWLAAIPAAASPSTGCGLAGKPSGDLHFKTSDGKGGSRDYEVLVPAPYNPSKPLAITFVYHGATGTSADAKGYAIQSVAGAGAASLFVFPQGIDYPGYGVGWDDACTGYDMPFFDHMLAALEASYCIDTQRVFVAGFSWGCDQVTALACCRGNEIRAVAAASCTDEFKDPTSYQSYYNTPCPVKSSAAIRFTHATDSDPAFAAPLFATTSALFRSFNGCSAQSTSVSPAPCKAAVGCSNAFIDCPYDGLGHALPSNWNTDTWAFFSATTGMPAAAPAVPVPSTRRPTGIVLGLILLGTGFIVSRGWKRKSRAH